MLDLLTASKILVGIGFVLAFLAVTVGGPDFLTLFLSFGPLAILGGVGCYTAAVLKELREEDII